MPRPSKGSFGVARRNKAQFAIALVDPRVAAVERSRLSRGLSHQQLCVRAHVDPATWRALRSGQQAPKGGTIERLERAVAAAPVKPKPAPITALTHAAEALLKAAIAGDPALAAAINDRRASKTPMPRLRTLAIYLVAVEVEAGNAEIGRALGMTRANVHKARNTIEELADNPMVRGLLDGIAALLRGEGP